LEATKTETHSQLLVYTADINSLGENTYTTEKNRRSVVTNKQAGLDGGVEKTQFEVQAESFPTGWAERKPDVIQLRAVRYR